MRLPEYLELPEASDPSRNFRVSVTLSKGAMICERNICLSRFLDLMNSQQYEMTFDDHPHTITRFRVDVVKRKLMLVASPLI
jgi:hypothetical protein